MLRALLGGLACLSFASVFSPEPIFAQSLEPRIAFVVGNSDYARGPLKTALNDAGLVAEALRSIGFDIIEGADQSQADILHGYREFLDKVEGAGPDAIAFVYITGYGLEFEGENYLIPTDARLERDSDIPLQAVRLSDLMRPLAGAPARAKIVVIDAARPLPFSLRGRPLVRGLGPIEALPGMLVGFASAPGLVAADGPGDYGPYATAIAEMIREPGLDLDAVFTKIRARVHQLTQGKQTPWNISSLTDAVILVPPDPQQARVSPPPSRTRHGARPMRDLGYEEAYARAIEIDTLEDYTEFIETYPRSPYSRRVFAIIRARREALAWLRALQINTPASYWSYLRRYPSGLYAFDAERRLRRLSAATTPPTDFVPIPFGNVPLPLPDEPTEFVDVELEFGPPPPRNLIAPPPALFTRLPPPQPPVRSGPRILPVPVPIPLMPRVAPAQQRRGAPTVNVAPTSPGGIPGGPQSRPSQGPASLSPSAPGTPPPAGTSPAQRPPQPTVQQTPPGPQQAPSSPQKAPVGAQQTPPVQQPPATQPTPPAPAITVPSRPQFGPGGASGERRTPPPGTAVPPAPPAAQPASPAVQPGAQPQGGSAPAAGTSPVQRGDSERKPPIGAASPQAPSVPVVPKPPAANAVPPKPAAAPPPPKPAAAPPPPKPAAAPPPKPAAAPPPPKPAAAPPPKPAAAPPPKPAAAPKKPRTPPPGKKCEIVNGQEVCK